MYLQKIPAGPRQWPQQALSAGLSPCPADRGPSYASWVLAEPWLLPVGGPFPRAGVPPGLKILAGGGVRGTLCG